MNLNLEKHPCFSDTARHKFGRVHLPVAPRCNIQCNFCNRKFDCVNESRPGVTSGILTPSQALAYVDRVMQEQNNISVIGIAGPGDPFANPEETLDTLKLIRKRFPDVLLCVASNGLQVLPYVNELKKLSVSHVTITLNAINPEIGAKIYSWVRYGKKVYEPSEGAEVLLDSQLAAIRALKNAGITVKINSIIIPGINDIHIPVIAAKTAEMGADIFNCLPYLNNKESVFCNIPEPDMEMTERIRKESSKFLPQMHHCTRCRADAVGLLNEAMTSQSLHRIIEFSQMECEVPPVKGDKHDTRNLVAVASREGLLINQHLGEATSFIIFSKTCSGIEHVDTREAPSSGSGNERWNKLSAILSDCKAVLVSGIGNNPKTILEGNGIKVLVLEGLINDAVSAVLENRSTNHMLKRSETACGAECRGSGVGCS